MEEKRDGEDCGAFVLRFELKSPPRSDQSPQSPLPLQGLTFAVKDIFNVEGYVAGFGNPDWARTHPVATSTAPVVLAVLEAGATCVGKTVMDEMAYSINGENIHYGTPINPAARDRVPGGSSSGSAVAVAAGLVDFALGTDTGGSVRVPASYCGIFGFRPSHASVSTKDVIPMAQSFDTVGWFARDPVTLTRVGRVLLDLTFEMSLLRSYVVVADDCFESLGSPNNLASILVNSVKKMLGHILIKGVNLGDLISREVPSLQTFASGSSQIQGSASPSLAALSLAMRLLQRFEFKTNHGEWILNVKPKLGPGISERVMEALGATSENLVSCHTIRTELQNALNSLLEVHGVLALPTVPGPPPPIGWETAKLEDFRAKAFSLLSIAGMSGFCQVTIPLGMYHNLPISISLMMRHGADNFLLNFAEALYPHLKEEATVQWASC